MTTEELHTASISRVLTLLSTPAFLRAFLFAQRAHKEQIRKYTGDPYIIHPTAVAALALHTGLSEHAVVAALLHDVIEDRGVTADDLLAAGFHEVAVRYVVALSDPPKDSPVYGTKNNREGRKAFIRERYKTAESEVQSVKLCDLIDNTKSIVEHDRNFAVKYLREKADLLEVLTNAHPDLIVRAVKSLNDGIGELHRTDITNESEVPST